MRHAAFEHFRQLHFQPLPLLLPTIWDARSAAACQAAGFSAVGTSSAAIASMLGYADGEQLPFAEVHYLVSRICASTTLPVTVDLEGGYSRDPAQIATHVQALAELGVVGINLEDSVLEGGVRRLLEPTVFANTLRTVRQICTKRQLAVFFNIRTDTYLLGTPNPRAATLARLRLYEAAGAHGLFVPGLTHVSETRDICAATQLPVNLMYLPGLPDFGTLAAAGVRRLSMGSVLFETLAARQLELSQRILQEQAFTALFA